jgi:hypothetical protein
MADDRDVFAFLGRLRAANPGVDVVRQITSTTPPPPKIARVVDPKEMFK